VHCLIQLQGSLYSAENTNSTNRYVARPALGGLELGGLH